MECMQGRADVLDLLARYLTSWDWTGSASDFMDRWLAAENAPNEAVLNIVKEIRESGMPCFVGAFSCARKSRFVSFRSGGRAGRHILRQDVDQALPHLVCRLKDAGIRLELIPRREQLHHVFGR